MPPLRSEERPSGLPSLRGQNLVRVEWANACYETAAAVFTHGHVKGVFVFIENPKNSYMWLVPCIASLLHLPGVLFNVFHMFSCMHARR